MPPRSPDELPRMVEGAEEDRPSITEVNGTVARFEMAYNPAENERFVFGPPLAQRLPSLVFVGFAATLGALAFLAHSGSGELHRYIVLEHRTPLVVLIVISALATFIRSGLRGVVVTRDAIETRTLTFGGLPRVRKWRWAQIDRIVIADEDVLFELWNGSHEHLPKVRDPKRLVELVERIATARGRHITRLATTARR